MSGQKIVDRQYRQDRQTEKTEREYLGLDKKRAVEQMRRKWGMKYPTKYMYIEVLVCDLVRKLRTGEGSSIVQSLSSLRALP